MRAKYLKAIANHKARVYLIAQSQKVTKKVIDTKGLMSLLVTLTRLRNLLKQNKK